MAFDIMGSLQENFDRTILRAMDPRSKLLDEAAKERMRKKLKEKGSGVWDRRKARWRDAREKRKIREEDY